MNETIELLVKVKINYTEKLYKKYAIEKAKECIMAVSMTGIIAGCKPKSVKLIKK